MGQTIRSSDDLILAANDGDNDDAGDLIFRTSGVERARISSSGVASGLMNVAESFEVTFGMAGTISAAAGAFRWPVPRAGSIVGVIAAVGTPSAGAAVICDVNVNGSTVFSTQANRPAILSGDQVFGLAVPDLPVLAVGDLVSVDVDQVGSGTAGANLRSRS